MEIVRNKTLKYYLIGLISVIWFRFAIVLRKNGKHVFSQKVKKFGKR